MENIIQEILDTIDQLVYLSTEEYQLIKENNVEGLKFINMGKEGLYNTFRNLLKSIDKTKISHDETVLVETRFQDLIAANEKLNKILESKLSLIDMVMQEVINQQRGTSGYGEDGQQVSGSALPLKIDEMA